MAIYPSEMVPLQIDRATASDGACSVARLTLGVPDTRRLVRHAPAALATRYGARFGAHSLTRQRRLFRPWDCSDLKADLPGRQRVSGARGRNNPAPRLTAAVHHVGVNDRAHDEAEHDRMRPAHPDPERIRWTPTPSTTHRSSNRPYRYPTAGPLLARLDGLGLFRPSRVGCPCRVGRFRHRSEQSRPRNNRRCSEVGTTPISARSASVAAGRGGVR